MSKGNLYYLVARNRKDNSLSVVQVDGSDANKLESIDLFTMKYKNEEQLAKELYSLGYIQDCDVDLFIVNRRESSVEIQEVIYNYARGIKEIAENSKNGNIKKSSDDINEILDGFSEMMEYNPKFFDMFMFTETNVYKKFLDYYAGSRLSGRVMYEVKYKDGAWANKSYKLIRNIIEAKTRFASYRYSGHNINRNDYYRRILTEKLIDITDKNYIENQLSLIGDIDDKSLEDKMLEVVSTFDRVIVSDFLSNVGHISLNRESFLMCSQEDWWKLELLLNDELALYVYRLAYNNSIFNIEASDVSKVAIVNLLKKDLITLNAAYEWCNVYNKYKNIALGDVNGNQYRKD